MLTGEGQIPAIDENRHGPGPGTYSPVTVHMEDTVGVVFLGILASMLLIALLRASARSCALMARFSARP
jgi:hypothetical protein